MDAIGDQKNRSRLRSLVDFEAPAAIKKSKKNDSPPGSPNLSNIQNEMAMMFLSQNQEAVKEMIGLLKSSGKLSKSQVKKDKLANSTDSFFSRLVSGTEEEKLTSFRTEAEILGYDLTKRKLAIVLFLDGFKENCLESSNRPAYEREETIKIWKQRIEEAMTNFFSKNGELITAYIGENKFLILKSVADHEDQKIKERLKKSHRSIFSPLKTNQIKSISLGFGHAYSEIEGLLESCHEADIALNMGLKLKERGRSYYLDDFGIMYTLAEGNLAKKALLADQMVSKIADSNLLKTLKSFLGNNLNITDTALELGIHRNTAIYRLEQITDKLGLDPRQFDQAVKIKLALFIKSLAS